MKDITTQLAESSNALGFDLWSQMRSTSGNLTISPISVSSALAMTYGGAKGYTSAEMAKVMHIDHLDVDVMVEYRKILMSLQTSPGVKLRIANRLFGETHYRFRQDYLNLVQETFGAEAERLDFSNDPEASRVFINAWIAGQTDNFVRDLLPAGSIDKTTTMVLTNAVYFLASWMTKFDKDLTYPLAFKLTNSDTSKAMMMLRNDKHRYGRVDDTQILELPYTGDNLSMLIALPLQVDGIYELERSLNLDKLSAWRRAVSTKKVDVHLPRFKIDPATSMDLVTPLSNLGMEDAFTLDANFTGMAPESSEPLHISSVNHKTFIRTDEDGTEAAAATATSMTRSMDMSDIPVRFRADHPFMFFVQDDSSGAVLFMGRVADPSKS